MCVCACVRACVFYIFLYKLLDLRTSEWTARKYLWYGASLSLPILGKHGGFVVQVSFKSVADGFTIVRQMAPRVLSGLSAAVENHVLAANSHLVSFC